MDVRYPVYCLAHPRFYESPERTRPDGGWIDYRDVVDAPPGWRQETDGQWARYWAPPGTGGMPTQGWKIHVSATFDSVDEILRSVSEYCFKHGIMFKFLPNSLVLQSRNTKYAPRQGSGKFLTLYPRDESELERALHDLDDEIGGLPGPYILSDLRWRDGPLHVRYGGFALRYAYGEDGVRSPAIERPDGVLVPDRREPRFTVPEWVRIPEFLAQKSAQRVSSEQPEEFPYEILGVLQFSNGGGVYRVRRLGDGVELVLKEGRPHAGLDGLRRDAPTRLKIEYSVLSDLKGIPGIPVVHDYHVFGGHDFLAEEYITGMSLQGWIATNYLFLTEEGKSRRTEYLESVEHIFDQLQTTLKAVHARGYLFNDLQPNNVMIGDDLRVSLIDFEAAQPVDHVGKRPLGTPGFAAPDSLRGIEADLYSLNAIRLFLYLPLNSLLTLCRDKAGMLISRAQSRMGLDDEVVESLTRVLAPPDAHGAGLRPAGRELAFTLPARSWEPHVVALTASIRAAATPDRQDRLFPGDVEQFFHGGGGGVAFGAAGVLHALRTAGETDLDPYVDWLERHLQASREPRFGLYDGMAGISHVLSNLGHFDTALTLYDRLAQESATLTGTKLFDGLSGIGLVSLDFHRRTGKPGYLEQALQAASAVEKAVESGTFAMGTGTLAADAEAGEGHKNSVHNFGGGLLYGWSGLALFLIRTFEVTGDERWLRAATAALHRDLDGCESRSDGTMQVRNKTRVLPYLATGSAGVALVADLLLNHVDDDRAADAMQPLSLACVPEFCVGAGLFNGRAGLVGAVRQVAGRLDWPDLDEHLKAGVEALDLHALADEHGLIFPGEQNLRASTDLATGSAGVLHLINVLAGRTTELLPFLGREPWTGGE